MVTFRIPSAVVFPHLLLVALIGCGGSVLDPAQEPGDSLPEPALLLTTDRPDYAASYLHGEGTYRIYGFTIIARLENRFMQRLFISRCFPNSPGPIYDVALIDGTDAWGSAYSKAWGCVGHDQQFPLEPGQIRVDTLALQGPWFFDGRTGHPFGTLAGRMRLLYGLGTCPGEATGCLLPRSQGQSNVFTVRLAQ